MLGNLGSSRSVAPDVKKPSTPVISCRQAFIAKHKKEPTEQLRQTFNKHSVSKWICKWLLQMVCHPEAFANSDLWSPISVLRQQGRVKPVDADIFKSKTGKQVGTFFGAISLKSEKWKASVCFCALRCCPSVGSINMFMLGGLSHSELKPWDSSTSTIHQCAVACTRKDGFHGSGHSAALGSS